MKVIYDINITFVHPPIPERHFDYRATRSNYEPGLPMGYGRTPLAALADLMDQEFDAEEVTPPATHSEG
jgi:hypothetical protein